MMRRMRGWSPRSPILALAAVLSLAACTRRAEPSWARFEALGAARPGEPTVAGEPVRVTRAAAPPRIDGSLDDAAWAGAALLGPLAQAGAGEPAATDHPVAAFARLTWDDTHLYLGVVVRDRRARSPFARDQKDPHIWAKASGIELMLQPGDPGDNRDYYELQIDVAGAVFDSHWDDYNIPISGSGPDRVYGHLDWSSRVERAVHFQEGGFYAIEAALPWAALVPGRTAIPPHAGDVWRLNLYSFRDGQRQALAWSPLRGQGNFHKSSRFGRVKFE